MQNIVEYTKSEKAKSQRHPKPRNPIMKRHLKQNKKSVFTTVLLGITLVLGLYIRAHNAQQSKPDPASIEYGEEWTMEDTFLGQ